MLIIVSISAWGQTICQKAEYKKQALLGDVFYPAVKLEMGKVTVALSTENGEPYAIVEFMSA